MLAEDTNAQRGSQLHIQPLQALTQVKLLFLRHGALRLGRQDICRALPGERPHQYQHDGAQGGEHQAGVEK